METKQEQETRIAEKVVPPMSAESAAWLDSVGGPVKAPGLWSDGNAFSVMGAASKALRRKGAPATVIDEMRKRAMAGDYDNLLQVVMGYAK